MTAPQIPSNLIPISISRLPSAPTPFPTGVVPIVVNGSLYQVDLATALGQIAVTALRRVSTSAPLQGGGTLQQDLTLSIADNSITSDYLKDITTANTAGGLTAIPMVTINSKGQVTSLSSVPIDLSQFALKLITFTPADASLTGGGDLSADRTLRVNYNDANLPEPLNGTGNTGSSVNPARADHQHPAVDLSSSQVTDLLPVTKGGTNYDPSVQAAGLSYFDRPNQQINVLSNPPAPSVGAPTNKILQCTEGLTPAWVDGGGAGTVYSVDLRQSTDAGQPSPPLFTVTTEGIANENPTLVMAWSAQNPNTVLAGPVSGPAAVPNYRTLVVDDLPTSGVTANTYGTDSSIPVITVDTRGRITNAVNTVLNLSANQIGSLGTGWNGTVATPWTSNVAITGGQINGASIGATNASTGHFTDLSADTFSVGGTPSTIFDTNIGGVSTGRAEGYFTTLGAEDAVIEAGTLNDVLIGDTTPNEGTFTELTANTAFNIYYAGAGRRAVNLVDGVLEDESALSPAVGGTGLNSPTGYLKFTGLTNPSQVTAIPNADLANSSISIGTTPPIPLGESGSLHNYLEGLSRVTVTTDPISALDLATKQYVDNVAVLGIHAVTAVRTATTANITLSGTQTVDGVALNVGDRVLVKNQTDETENGLYDVQASLWTRTSDANIWDELVNAYVFVTITGSGTQTQGGSGWLCNVDTGGTLGVTDVTFVQFSGGGGYSAGTGLTLTGSQFSITSVTTAGSVGSASQTPVLTYNAEGQITTASATNINIDASAITSGVIGSVRLNGNYSFITGVGQLVNGIWNANTIAVSYGGTGATSLTGYVRGNGTSAMTATASIPSTDVSGLGTMATQNANDVAITGGYMDGVPIGTSTPSNAFFNGLGVFGAGSEVSLDPAVLSSIDNVNIGEGTPGTGRFTNLSATGAITFTSGSIDNVPVGATTANTGRFTSLTSTSATVNGPITINSSGTSVGVTLLGSSNGYFLDASGASPSAGYNNGQAIRAGRLDFLSAGKTLNPTVTAGQVEFDGSKLYFSTTVDSTPTRVDISTFDTPGSALAYSFILS